MKYSILPLVMLGIYMAIFIGLNLYYRNQPPDPPAQIKVDVQCKEGYIPVTLRDATKAHNNPTGTASVFCVPGYKLQD